jgi:hypothetical protein
VKPRSVTSSGTMPGIIITEAVAEGRIHGKGSRLGEPRIEPLSRLRNQVEPGKAPWINRVYHRRVASGDCLLRVCDETRPTFEAPV